MASLAAEKMTAPGIILSGLTDKENVTYTYLHTTKWTTKGTKRDCNVKGIPGIVKKEKLEFELCEGFLEATLGAPTAPCEGDEKATLRPLALFCSR